MLPATPLIVATVLAEFASLGDAAGNAAASAFALALNVSVTELPGSADAGIEVAVTPDGNPARLTATGVLPVPPIATLSVCELPG
jgi:hypothetical protein